MHRADLPDILTIPDIAMYLRISRSKAYELAKLPGFPAIRLDGTIRVRKDKFFAWLDALDEQEIAEPSRRSPRSWPGSVKEGARNCQDPKKLK